MNHRHLLPNEIDLLVDGEVGFGVAPLRTHVEACAECGARLESARAVVDALEHLPHLAPSFRFADRVMSQVQVFVPPEAAARDAVRVAARRWLPRSRPARALVGALAGSAALVLTAMSIWLVTNVSGVAFAMGILYEASRAALLDAAGAVATAALGAAGADAVRQTGVVGLAVVTLTLVFLMAVAALGLRAIAGSAHRRRS